MIIKELVDVFDFLFGEIFENVARMISGTPFKVTIPLPHGFITGKNLTTITTIIVTN